MPVINAPANAASSAPNGNDKIGISWEYAMLPTTVDIASDRIDTTDLHSSTKESFSGLKIKTLIALTR